MEMLSLLKHLWPNFTAMFNGEAQGLSTIFWIMTMGVLSLSLYFVANHYRHFLLRWKLIAELLAGQERDTLAINRRSTLQKAQAQPDPQVGHIWREFDESLVLSSDGSLLHNTLDADHFFNDKTLAQGLTGSRLLAAAPSFLVALGVLGTFVGLTVGLVRLNLDSAAGVDVLRDGISGLIQGASVAFMTSVWGVGCSLLLNFIEKLVERNALTKILALQHRIDFLYPRLPAEQSLVSIAESSRQAKEALQELHERIGDRLQVAFNGFAGMMHNTLTDTLNGIMKPAIESLVKHSADQSTTALEQLVQRFMDGMTENGRKQGDLMNSSTERLNQVVNGIDSRLQELTSLVKNMQDEQQKLSASHAALAGKLLRDVVNSAQQNQAELNEKFSELLGNLTQQFTHLQTQAHENDESRRQRLNDQFSELNSHQGQLLDAVSKGVTETQLHSKLMAKQHDSLLQELSKVSIAMADSSRHMDNSASQLGILGSKVESASTSLGARLHDVANRMDSSLTQTIQLTAQQKEQAASMQHLQDAISSCMQDFREAAGLTRTALVELKQRQEELLRNTRTEFMRLADTLREQVLKVEEQARSWLESYSNQVNHQVSERMQDWNRHSMQYATEMLRISQSLNSVIDELEARQS